MAEPIRIQPGRPETFGEVFLDLTFPSDLGEKARRIPEIIDLLQKRGYVRPDEDAMPIVLSLDEALVNAIVHGSGRDRGKNIVLRLFGDESRWGITIEDEGSGFDPASLPDPDDPETLMMEGGRGVLLITNLMDEVSYHDRGNRMRMVRARRNAS